MTITFNNQPTGPSEGIDYQHFGTLYRVDGKIFLKIAAFQDFNKQAVNLSDLALTSPGAHDGRMVEILSYKLQLLAS